MPTTRRGRRARARAACACALVRDRVNRLRRLDGHGSDREQRDAHHPLPPLCTLCGSNFSGQTSVCAGHRAVGANGAREPRSRHRGEEDGPRAPRTRAVPERPLPLLPAARAHAVRAAPAAARPFPNGAALVDRAACAAAHDRGGRSGARSSSDRPDTAAEAAVRDGRAAARPARRIRKIASSAIPLPR